MLKVTAHRLTIPSRTVIECPIFTKFLGVSLDPSQGHCILWALSEDEEPTKKEKCEVIMISNEDELQPVSASYVGCLKVNSGMTFVFVSRESTNPLIKVPYFASK